MATNPVGMNLNSPAAGAGESSSAKAAEEDAPPAAAGAAVAATNSSSSTAATEQQQSNENISEYSDLQLKALLDEAMTYKNRKDLEHKSETFKELLRRAETENQSQESNFVYIPYPSSGGGSLQNIFESVNSEPRNKYSSSGASNPRRHQGYFKHGQHYHAGGAGGHGVGGGHHQHHQGGHGHRSHGGSGFVSGRQGEGGSLPSNVNTRSAEMHPFIAEMAAGPGKRHAKNSSESGRTSDEYEMGTMLNGDANKGRSVAARGTTTGLYGGDGVIRAEMASPMSVVINMGEEQDEEEVVSIQQAKKATTQQLQSSSRESGTGQQQQFRTNLKIDIDHGAGPDAQSEKGNGGSVSGGGSAPGGGYEKLSTVSGGGPSLERGGGGSTRTDGAEQVDKSIKLSLEPKGAGPLDPMANAYMSMKNGRVDSKPEMIIVSPSQSGAGHDRELSTDLDWARSIGKVQQKRALKHKPKYERNMTTIVSDEIIGYRGEEKDLDRLVQFIESKENEEKQQQQQSGKQHDAKGKGKNRAANKREQEQKHGGGKLKKSNSMNELRSCSKLDEEASTTTAATPSGVVLRQKATKSKTTSAGAASQSEAKSQPEVKTASKQRGDRRSWGTEELQYLGEADSVAGGDSFIVDTNNNMSAALKKSNGGKKLPDKSAEMVIPTKTLGELPVNSVSMESLVSSSWGNEEFHVVTKKRKSKKKQNIVVQPFEAASKAVVARPQSQSVAESLALDARSQKSARNRPNNLIASITSNSSSSRQAQVGRTTHLQPSSSTTTATTNNSGAGGGGKSKSRRKSTSSVPPSEHSDCSDLDSVHSLPIESPSTAKAKAGNNSSSSKSKAKASGGGTAATGGGVSYADITKTASKKSPPPPGNSSGAVNGGDKEDRDVKWPSIGGGDEDAVAVVAEKPTWVNGVEDMIKNSQAATVARSTEVIHVAAAGVGGGEAVPSKTLLQKSKSVDNESSGGGGGFNMNIDQYPSLEKTVNRKQLGTVNNNNSGSGSCSSSQLSSSGKEAPVANGVAGKRQKLLSTIVSDNGQAKPVSLNNGVCEGAEEEEEEKEKEREELLVEARKMAVKINNNLSATVVNNSSGCAPAGAAAVEAVSSKGGKSGAGGAKTTRNRTNSMPQITSSAVATGLAASAAHQHQRPAVIMLNEPRYNAQVEGSDLIFGFDVNNQLLFGDFEEDEIRLLDEPAGGKGADQINTSDYNSYNSSMCSTTALGTSTGGQGASAACAEGLVFDSNNNPNDDTAEELEVPPVAVSQPQSTPKSVGNCSNCTREGSEGSEGSGGGGVTLMKNSCVQTSLDNLILAPELSNGGVVVTVSDLESRAVAEAAAAGKKNKRAKVAATVVPANWADAAVELDKNGNAVEQEDGEEQENQEEQAEGGESGQGFNSIKVKLQQFALINAQFARQAPMGWMCHQMNSFFNNHENVINFVGLAWEDLTHNKSSALKYYEGQ